MKIQGNTITVLNCIGKITIELGSDSDIDDWVCAMRTLLMFQGFASGTIDEYIDYES